MITNEGYAYSPKFMKDKANILNQIKKDRVWKEIPGSNEFEKAQYLIQTGNYNSIEADILEKEFAYKFRVAKIAQGVKDQDVKIESVKSEYTEKIEVFKDVKVPGTNIILEKGDIVHYK